MRDRLRQRIGKPWIVLLLFGMMAIFAGCEPDDALTGPSSSDDSTGMSTSAFRDGGMGYRYADTWIDQGSGGVLTFHGGTLSIPADSIDGSKLIWAQTYSLTHGDFLKRVYEFGPSGTTFSTPATLTLNYCDMGDVLPGTIRLLLYNEETGEWEVASHMVNDPATRTFTGTIEHFSRYSLSGNGQVLQPKIEGN